MSNVSNVIQGMINNALMQTHTAFCGKVLSVSGDFAKVQPLHMTKAVGGKAQKLPPITNVPILKPSYKTNAGYICDIKVGDTVFCVCAERDITETRKGKFALPVQGRHMLSDAVIVGKL